MGSLPWYDIGSLLIGGGIFLQLMKMNKTLGGLEAKVAVLWKDRYGSE